MLKRWLGPLLALFILGGVAVILLTNLDVERTSYKPLAPISSGAGEAPPSPQPPRAAAVAGFREYPIGEEQEKNHMRIAAVWLPSVQVDGPNLVTGADVVHLEADIHATSGNPNGFALDEFVPYLVITYRIEPASGGPALSGPMVPMVAADGLHYGAGVRLPGPGQYRLTYHIEPPSKGGLGRHHDPITGVAPWWQPFDVPFAWDFQGLPAAKPR